MAASQKKLIFDQNFGLKLFIKKKYLSVKKNLRLITKKYIQEACVKIGDWSLQLYSCPWSMIKSSAVFIVTLSVAAAKVRRVFMSSAIFSC